MRLGHFNFQFSLLYQALECPEQFIGYTGDILLEAEILVNLQRLEVRMHASVSLTGDCDVPTLEHVRITLTGCRRNGLDEGDVLVVIIILTFNVAAQNALIVLTGLQALVVAQKGFQIHGQFRVAVPALEHLCYDVSHEAGLV